MKTKSTGKNQTGGYYVYSVTHKRFEEVIESSKIVKRVVLHIDPTPVSADHETYEDAFNWAIEHLFKANFNYNVWIISFSNDPKGRYE